MLEIDRKGRKLMVRNRWSRHNRHAAVGRLCQEKKDGCYREDRSDSAPPYSEQTSNEATSIIGELIIRLTRQPKLLKFDKR